MKKNSVSLILYIALPLAVGALAYWFSGGGTELFAELSKPPLSPPTWLFPVVWTILYGLMGIASWLVMGAEATEAEKSKALRVYLLQLAVNFFWPILFFRFELYLPAFLWLLLLWILIFVTGSQFSKISDTAGKLMIPYLLWVTFAGYLNLGVWLLNR